MYRTTRDGIVDCVVYHLLSLFLFESLTFVVWPDLVLTTPLLLHKGLNAAKEDLLDHLRRQDRFLDGIASRWRIMGIVQRDEILICEVWRCY